MENQKSFQARVLEKQVSFQGDPMDKQPGSRLKVMDRTQSFGGSTTDRQQSFRARVMEKQRSFKLGFLEKQKSFREKKAKAGAGGKRRDTALHVAVRAGSLAEVQQVLSGSDAGRTKEMVAAQNEDGETALYVAAENGQAEIAREVLKHCDSQLAALKANNGFDAFHIAARHGHLDVIKELTSFSPELAMTTNSVNSTALDTAATQGHLEVVNFLLETNPGLAKIARNNGKTALHSAARNGCVEVVKSILNKDSSIGFKIDKKGQTALHMAVKGQNIMIVQELINPDPSVANIGDLKGNTPLHIATRKGRIQMVQNLVTVEGVNVNAFNKAGETAIDIAEKAHYEEIEAILRAAGGVAAKDHANPPSPAKNLKKTVSDIKHDVQSQIQQTRQTGMHVHKIKKKLKKLHIGGLNNAINSNTVVAVLIATIAFAAIFTLPGQYVEEKTEGFTLGQAYIADDAAFIIFFVSDALSLFISLSVVVVQTSLIVTEQKAKTQMVFVINKLMWLACVFISVSFISLTFVVVGHQDWWLAWSTTAIGASIMLSTIGSMCYCIIMHRIGQKNTDSFRRPSKSQSLSWSVPVASDSELFNNGFKMYAL